MATMTLSELSKKMAGIDFTMLATRTESGEIAGRPMSNNGDVDYTGDSHFFSWEDSRKINDIKREPKVAMSFVGTKSLLGKPPIFIHVEGEAELIRDKAAFEEHWQPDLERWFEQGVETPGLVMIKVHATLIHYWDGNEEGEVTV